MLTAPSQKNSDFIAINRSHKCQTRTVVQAMDYSLSGVRTMDLYSVPSKIGFALGRPVLPQDWTDWTIANAASVALAAAAALGGGGRRT